MFLADLSLTDLRRLRAVVKAVHLRHYPVEMVTDYEADRVIEAIGPEIAARIVRQAVAKGAVE